MSRAILIIEGSNAEPFEFALRDLTTVGRGASNDVPLEDPAASRRQTMIRATEPGGFLVSDLGSANGTFLNGTQLLAPARLKSGDVLTIGSTRLTFRTDERAAPRREEPNEDATRVRDDSRSAAVLLGTSTPMVELLRLIEKASASPLPTLLEGETGTGKELVARAIHQSSSAVKGPFLPVNCAAVPENLLESELFGHRRGAFTGATGDHEGLFEAAQGGTVFLDEIGEIRPRKVAFRLIAATNRDLLREVDRGTFRSDLFYRISAFPIPIPRLRDRRDDIPLLVESFLASAARRQGKRVGHVSAEAMRALVTFSWPGNVRELQNEIQRAVALANPGEGIGLAGLSAKVRGEGDAREADGPDPTAPPGVQGEEAAESAPGSLREARNAFEARYIAEVLEQEGGSVLRAARVLGLTRAGLYKKLKEYGLR